MEWFDIGGGLNVVHWKQSTMWRFGDWIVSKSRAGGKEKQNPHSITTINHLPDKEGKAEVKITCRGIAQKFKRFWLKSHGTHAPHQIHVESGQQSEPRLIGSSHATELPRRLFIHLFIYS